jgi:hypothetical protein
MQKSKIERKRIHFMISKSSSQILSPLLFDSITIEAQIGERLCEKVKMRTRKKGESEINRVISKSNRQILYALITNLISCKVELSKRLWGKNQDTNEMLRFTVLFRKAIAKYSAPWSLIILSLRSRVTSVCVRKWRCEYKRWVKTEIHIVI